MVLVFPSGVATGAGSIPSMSTYRDTSESSMPILGGITIVRYIKYRDIL